MHWHKCGLVNVNEPFIAGKSKIIIQRGSLPGERNKTMRRSFTR